MDNISNLTNLIETKLKAVVAGYTPQEAERVEGLLCGAVNSLVDLVCVHWKGVDDMLLDSDKAEARFSMSVKIDNSEKQAKVTSKISYARRTSDTVEIPIDKPVEFADA